LARYELSAFDAGRVGVRFATF